MSPFARIAAFLVLIGVCPPQLKAQIIDRAPVQVHVASQDLQILSKYSSTYSIENFRNDTFQVALSGEDYAALKNIVNLSRDIYDTQLTSADMAKNLEEAMSFQKYPNYFQYDSMMQYFALAYPDICRLDTIGESLQGRILFALKISDNPAVDEDEPAFMYSSTMHGDELVGYVLLLRLIDFLLENYTNNIEVQRLINTLEIWINPLANPDGTFYPDNNLSLINARRYNAEGYDLNRTYPDVKNNEADDTTGVPHENQLMMLFLKEKGINLSANLHAGEEVVNYPWDHKSQRHPDDDWFIFISREYADEARVLNPAYMNNFTDGITNGYDWYTITGGRQDYVTYFCHGREVTLELSTSYKLATSLLDIHWDYNKWSLINYMAQAMYGIHGHVSSAATGTNIAARISVLSHDNDSSIVFSDPTTGIFYRYLKEAYYDLKIEAEGYITDTLFAVELKDYQASPLEITLDSLISGVDMKRGTDYMKLYPNPARDHLLVSSSIPFSQNSSLRITDIRGSLKQLYQLPEGKNTYYLNLSNLERGLYIIQISTADFLESETIILK